MSVVGSEAGVVDDENDGGAVDVVEVIGFVGTDREGSPDPDRIGFGSAEPVVLRRGGDYSFVSSVY